MILENLVLDLASEPKVMALSGWTQDELPV
jgi:hypothetical protein